jgi:Flp pilus assembly protein TadG
MRVLHHPRGNSQPASRAARSGAVALEMALILPVLLTLILGAVDYGRVYSMSMMLATATRVGAEQGATYRLTPLTQPAWENRVRSAVIEQMQTASQFDIAELSLQVETTTTTTGVRVQVSTNYPFQTIVAWPGLPRTVNLGARITIHQYR